MTVACRSALAHYPVAIVGAGPTGLTLANLLGRAGVNAVLIERNATTVGEPRAVSIDDESLRTMQSAGLVDTVMAKVVPGYGSHYYYAPGRSCFVRVEPTGTPYGYPRRNAFRQPILERQLREGLARFAGVHTLFGHTLTAFSPAPDRVALSVQGPGGDALGIGCDYLVGCDGASSTVRHGLGIKLEGSSFSERWLIVDLENSENRTRHTEVFCNPIRPCITLPGPERTRRFEFMLHPHEREEELLAASTIERLLAEHGAHPRSTIRRKVVYTFHARVATRWSSGRVFLAGDAAHLTPPFAGQGMNSGLRDAHNLAWKLALVARGQAGPGILASYEPERRDHAWQMIELALRMGRIMAPRSRLGAFLVQSGFRIIGLWPPARDYVAQMKYKPKPRFARGFVVPDRRSARRTLVGRMFPQPTVRTADGRRLRLDEVLGDRFALLARGDDARLLASLQQPVWEQLGTVRVAVCPPGPAASFPPGVVVVTEDDDSCAAAFAGYPGHVILLRPDHYVAACLPLGAIEQGVRDVARLLEQTWEQPPARDEPAGAEGLASRAGALP